jgi:hypothetical protein
MKSGVLVYEPGYGSQNIGDYIQSLAAKQFLPPDGEMIYVHREKLDEYNGDPIRVIMNGWFTHHPEHWPPSKSIKPLFVAFHINSTAKDKLLQPNGVMYLKQFEPIGCRDMETMRLLQAHNISAYYSGCLTLTLGKSYTSEEKDGAIYFADPIYPKNGSFAKLIKALPSLLLKRNIISHIISEAGYGHSISAWVRAATFYRSYSKMFSDELMHKAKFSRHIIPESEFANEDAKFNTAENFLNKYSRAKIVVTNRIHCALPCIGMGTPVIYLNDLSQSEASSCRLEGLLQFFNVVDYDNGTLRSKSDQIHGKIKSDTIIRNKENHKAYVDSLIRNCEQFVLETEQNGK